MGWRAGEDRGRPLQRQAILPCRRRRQGTDEMCSERGHAQVARTNRAPEMEAGGGGRQAGRRERRRML